MYVKKLSRKRYNSKKLRKSKRTTRRRRLIKKRGGDFCYNFTNNLHNMISICKEQVFIELTMYEYVDEVAQGLPIKSDIFKHNWIEEEYKRLRKLRSKPLSVSGWWGRKSDGPVLSYRELPISEKIEEIKKKLIHECFLK